MHFFLVRQHTTDDSGIVMHCKSTQDGRADSGADNTMTTEQFHEELRQYNFHKVGTGGGCDALVSHLLYMESGPFADNAVSVKARQSAEVMLTSAEDPSVPEADEQVQITIRMEGSDYEVTWIASPQETLNFAGSVTTWRRG